MPRILLLQGANLSALGKLEPALYGTTTAAELDALLQEHAQTNHYTLDIYYTNIEGEAINRIYQAADAGIDGLVMNPGGFNYAGYALRTCVRTAGLPYIEVHITNLAKRGIESVLSSVASGVIYGLGTYGYILSLQAMLDLLSRKKIRH